MSNINEHNDGSIAQPNETHKATVPTNQTAPPASASVLHVVAPAPATPRFEILLRGIGETAAQGVVVAADSASATLSKVIIHNVSSITEPVFTWSYPDELVALDFDRPDDASPLSDADVPALMTKRAPMPPFAWVTHGAGLRVVFHREGDKSALALAGSWYLLAPLGPLAHWPVEVKTDTRHPYGARGTERCGAVFRFPPTTNVVLREPGGTVDDADVLEWQTARGLTPGRHPADRCPWQPKTISGNAPVVVNEWGVRCHHCGHRAPWSELVGRGEDVAQSLYRAARAFVHLSHQRHVIVHGFPRMPDVLIQPAWEHLLREVNQDRLAVGDEEVEQWEKRVRRAGTDSISIARSSSGAWLDSTTLEPRKVSVDLTLKYLPSCFWPPMVDCANNPGPLQGFAPIHPIGCNEVVGPFVHAPRGTIVIPRPRGAFDPPPVQLSPPPSLTELDQAWTVLDVALPGISAGYHQALVAAMLAAQRGVGTPPMITATGQSGSAKTAQIHLAAGALGTRVGELSLGGADDTARMAGLALEEGAGILFVDEVGRVDGLFTKIGKLLEANSRLRFRPKFANERTVPMRAAIALLGSTLPESIVHSPELARRGVAFRLLGAEKKWTLIDPVNKELIDLSAARRIEIVRDALDVVTRHVWWRVHDLGPGGDWRQLALTDFGAVPLASLDLVDTDGQARDGAIRWIYDCYRKASKHEFSRDPGWVEWLHAMTGTSLADQLAVLVELDADNARFKAISSDLERLNLAPILGVSRPQLQLTVRRRSAKVLVKFVEVGVAKGKGTPRNQLPLLDAHRGVAKPTTVVI